MKRKGPWSLDRIYTLFPILRDKRNAPGTALSGGQQQMVTIGRALMSNPDVVLFDEISLGLAPVVIKDIYAALPGLLGAGMTAIVVEQDITRALSPSPTPFHPDFTDALATQRVLEAVATSATQNRWVHTKEIT